MTPYEALAWEWIIAHRLLLACLLAAYLVWRFR